MPELSAPVVVVAGSFLSAMREFQAEGRGGADDNSMIGAEIREWQARWDTPDGFAGTREFRPSPGFHSRCYAPPREFGTSVCWDVPSR